MALYDRSTYVRVDEKLCGRADAEAEGSSTVLIRLPRSLRLCNLHKDASGASDDRESITLFSRVRCVML